jgi:hypothetical protein
MVAFVFLWADLKLIVAPTIHTHTYIYICIYTYIYIYIYMYVYTHIKHIVALVEEYMREEASFDIFWGSVENLLEM